MKQNTKELIELPDSFAKRSAIAKEKGFEYLGRLMQDDRLPTYRLCDYGRYKRLACGHTHTVCHRNMENFKKLDHCKQCIQQSYIDLATSLDMEFVDFSRKSKNGTLYVDVKLPCGHFKSIQTGNLKTGAYHCKERWLNNFILLLKSYDITFVKHTIGNYYSVILPCGCSTEKHIGNLKLGSWTCPKHKSSPLYGKGYIYLFEIEFKDEKRLKMGFSVQPETRCKFFSEYDIEVELIKAVRFDEAKDALRQEKKLHSKYKEHKLSSNAVLDVMSSGFTECYPTFLLQDILEDFDKLEFKLKELAND